VSEFDGTIVLVTGCARARGMGRAISVAFARAGADVIVTDVAVGGTRNENEEGLEEIRLGWKGLELARVGGRGRAAIADGARPPASMRGEDTVIDEQVHRGPGDDGRKLLQEFRWARKGSETFHRATPS